jgi:hypothetical protein
MLDKIKGILFLIPCFVRVAYEILMSRKWNMIIIDLENSLSCRIVYWYRLSNGKYVLEKTQTQRDFPNA